MRLSKSDFFITALGLSIIAGLGYLLYTDITTGSGPGNTKRIGKITASRNIAERKFSNRVVWGGVSKNTPLYNYDTVRTADQSETSIRLDDGTEITLSENSMILLALSESEVDIKFIQGTINAKQSAAVSGAAKKINIDSGGSSVSLKNGDVSISQDSGDRLQMTVNRGTATLKTGNDEKIINENQNIVAEKDGVRLYDLTIQLLAPVQNASIDSTGAKTAVAFSWETPRGEYDTSLEIANNPGVSDPLINRKVRGKTHSIDLQDGVYFWRVNAVNRESGKVESSEIRKLSVFSNKPVTLIAPANNSTIKYRDENPMIAFIWSKNESVSRYNLLVSKKADMSSPVINSVVETNRIAMNDLGQGSYFWKVANVNVADREQAISESPVFAFTVSKTEKLEPPQPVFPTDDRAVHPLSIVQKGLTFNWTKDPSIIKTLLLLAEDRDLEKVIFKKTIGGNNIKFTGKLTDGNYFWGLRGVMKDGSMTDFSSVRRLKVIKSGAIALIEPQNGAFIINKAPGMAASVDFSWSKTELEGKYRLQVSRVRDFSKVMKEISVADLSAVIPDIYEGRYFWRVALVDDSNTTVMTSPVGSFEIMALLDNPVPISPLGGSAIDMLKKDTLNFYWKPVKGANYYRIGLYQVKGLIKYSIATLETRNNYYVFSDLKKLDVGKFLWTLQAIDIDPAANRIKRKSEEVKMVFDIKLGIKGDLKLDTPNIIHTE